MSAERGKGGALRGCPEAASRRESNRGTSGVEGVTPTTPSAGSGAHAGRGAGGWFLFGAGQARPCTSCTWSSPSALSAGAVAGAFGLGRAVANGSARPGDGGLGDGRGRSGRAVRGVRRGGLSSCSLRCARPLTAHCVHAGSVAAPASAGCCDDAPPTCAAAAAAAGKARRPCGQRRRRVVWSPGRGRRSLRRRSRSDTRHPAHVCPP